MIPSRTPKRYTVTAALPYANGPLHIGHIAGCYLPADIYVRYMRSAGEDIIFVCGSDEHGVPITLRAAKEGVSPQQVVDKYHTMMKNAFEEFGIAFSIYSRTSARVHHETAQEIFLKLYEKNIFTEETTKQYYDEAAQQFLADRYIIGTCPNCGNENAYGDQCEKCGTSLSPNELINPRSALSGNAPVLKETKHWFLPLNDFTPWLREWLLEGHKHDWKTNVYGQCRSWIEGGDGLQPRAMTRDLDWGVKVPLPDAEGKVLYVWFDAPIGYISATKELTADWKKYWQDEDTALIHFIGKDNIVFHCIIFPVILHAHGDYIVPTNVPANEFLNLEGDKISTSRNWAVWLHEYLEDFPGKQDVLRYVLCANAPENKDNDFSWKDFQAKNNNELAAILGNLVNRVVTLTHKYYNGVIPARGLAKEPEFALVEEAKNAPGNIGTLIRGFKFRDALQDFMNLARAGNKYLTDTEPWKLVKTDAERTATVMHYGLQLLAELSILAEPFLPHTAKKLRTALGVSETEWKSAGKMHLLKEGNTIGQCDILFAKIEDEVVEKQIQKLQGTKAQPAVIEPAVTSSSSVPAFKENISYDDFAKLDLRIAKVLAAERVPKTNKLMKLSIDLGSEKRTVVSGIAEYFTPEEVTGRQVCMVANLAPRELKGIMSQGMILMIEDSKGRLQFVQPDGEAPNGAIVK
jgi:methionyl-tRNA synthetase